MTRADDSARTLRIGFNLPWSFRYCGYDFGHPPPGWRRAHPSPRRFDVELGPLFERLAGCGVEVVRVFVLADGIAYPELLPLTDFVALPRDGAPEGSVETRRVGAPPLPPLSDAFVADFTSFLDAAHARGLRVLPSLVSFEAFFEPHRAKDGVVKAGRGALALGPRRDAAPEAVDAFFAATLDRLLAIAGPSGQRAHPAVFAWEVMNEPEWCVKRGVVDAPAMERFLLAGVRRIVAAGYVASVGFVRAEPAMLGPAASAELAELARRGAYLHQLHHYPKQSGRYLSRADATPFGEATMVGEMASRDGEPTRWPEDELAESELDRERYLLARLHRVERLGYRWAFLWSVFASDDKSGFDERVERQLARFTRRPLATEPDQGT